MKAIIASVLIALSLGAGVVAPAAADTLLERLDSDGRGGHHK